MADTEKLRPRCEHGRRRRRCKDCGTGHCEHRRRRSRCPECSLDSAFREWLQRRARYRGTKPNFDNFDERKLGWLVRRREMQHLRALLSRLALITTALGL
jgi:hypothetical protein